MKKMKKRRKIDLKKWWAYFGLTLFILMTVSIVVPALLYVEALIYLGGIVLAVITIAKLVKDFANFYSQKTKAEEVE